MQEQLIFCGNAVSEAPVIISFARAKTALEHAQRNASQGKNLFYSAILYEGDHCISILSCLSMPSYQSKHLRALAVFPIPSSMNTT